MITGISGGSGIAVDSGGTSLPYISNSADNFSGLIRVNGGGLQYYDNGCWNSFPTSRANVRLDGSVESLLNWVREKQAEEYKQKSEIAEMERRAKEHPSLEKAYAAVLRAEMELNAGIDRAVENFKTLDRLIGNDVQQYQDEKSI